MVSPFRLNFGEQIRVTVTQPEAAPSPLLLAPANLESRNKRFKRRGCDWEPSGYMIILVVPLPQRIVDERATAAEVVVILKRS
jgi:hypothetical protein